ncbi:32407_t:CDS:1, partial [Racocetra persica]
NSVTLNRAYRSLRNILFIIIPKLTDEKPAVLQVGDVIHIKLSGDG